MTTYSNRFYLNKLPPDEPLGETDVVVLFYIYIYRSRLTAIS